MTLKFTSAKDSIKNYQTSVIAKGERSDCVVRAIAAASDWDYDSAHKFVEKEFNRQPRKGTMGFIPKMCKLVNDGRRLNRKTIKTISSTSMMNGSNRMTVGSFVKLYDKGSYVVVISGHAFAIKNGEVVGGNTEDAKRMRCIVKGVWKIG